MRKERRWWVTSVFKSRGKYSGSNLLSDLNVENLHFHTFCRMSPSNFEEMINLIGLKIMKKNTTFRKAIPVKERLAVTLRYLASGDSYTSLSFLFKFSKQSISLIVPEVCTALCEVLQDFIKMPRTENEWLQVAAQFDRLCNIPHCMGAMDGKHIILQCPINTGSDYFNYKGTFSIVLFAVVDADYCFLYADVGCQGRISDGGVFRNTTFYKKLEDGSLNLPSSKNLPGREMLVPYVFVADDAFPLHNNIMKPYSGQQEKGSSKRIFNYRISRARRIVENVFGILSAVFRVLRKPLLLEPQKAQVIVMACVYLHNYLRRNARKTYTPTSTFDCEQNGEFVPGNWRNEPEPNDTFQALRNIPRKSSQNSQSVRNEFADYFVNQGKVPWQDNYL